jgi:hypothetical protein
MFQLLMLSVVMKYYPLATAEPQLATEDLPQDIQFRLMNTVSAPPSLWLFNSLRSAPLCSHLACIILICFLQFDVKPRDLKGSRGRSSRGYDSFSSDGVYAEMESIEWVILYATYLASMLICLQVCACLANLFLPHRASIT